MQSAPHCALQDAAPGTPIFVFLSPGVDVAASVEGLGRKLGFTADTGHYSAVSLGQGQEPIAMNNLTNAHKNGGWVLLQNIHLTIDWTSGPLEKKVDKLTEGAHKDFRCVSDTPIAHSDQGHCSNKFAFRCKSISAPANVNMLCTYAQDMTDSICRCS